MWIIGALLVTAAATAAIVRATAPRRLPVRVIRDGQVRDGDPR